MKSTPSRKLMRLFYPFGWGAQGVRAYDAHVLPLSCNGFAPPLACLPDQCRNRVFDLLRRVRLALQAKRGVEFLNLPRRNERADLFELFGHPIPDLPLGRNIRRTEVLECTLDVDRTDRDCTSVSAVDLDALDLQDKSLLVVAEHCSSPPSEVS